MAILDFLSAHLVILYKRPNAYHQVLIQLDYGGDVQNMNSQHFSHINVYGPYKCMRSKFDLAVKRSNVNVGLSF